jgi:hypothetical protein
MELLLVGGPFSGDTYTPELLVVAQHPLLFFRRCLVLYRPRLTPNRLPVVTEYQNLVSIVDDGVASVKRTTATTTWGTYRVNLTGELPYVPFM